MRSLTHIGLSAIITGTVASLASTAALAFAARVEGRGALQPTNATSHWLHGEKAARTDAPDLEHTALGYATHHASTVFWALPFEAWLSTRPPRTSLQLLRDALVMSSVAAAIDYTVTPKRLTPGWELVLSKRSMVTVYGAMALGLFAGNLVARTLIGSSEGKSER